MRRLVAGGLVPDRAGQPAKVWAHISLADLIDLDADSALQAEWIARVRAQWAAARAAASIGGGDGAAWLEGDAAKGFACDASITPVVTGDINTAVLDDLVRLCMELAGHGPGCCGPGEEDTSTSQEDTSAGARQAGGHAGGPVPPTERGREALEMAIIGKTTILLLHYVDACDLRLHPRKSSRPMSVALEESARAILPDRRHPISDQGQHSVSASAPPVADTVTSASPLPRCSWRSSTLRLPRPREGAPDMQSHRRSVNSTLSASKCTDSSGILPGCRQND